MAQLLPDVDRFYSGRLDAATPNYLLEEGVVARLINGRFYDGAITNALGFDELPILNINGPRQRYFSSPLTYDDLFAYGDPQLMAPLQGADGEFLVFVISGRLFLYDPNTFFARDITILDSYLPDNSLQAQLSFIGNEGGSAGIGGTLVIFNDMNRPLFITARNQRLSQRILDEMPPSRLGVTAGNRAFVFSGNNVMWASDPVGTPGAPLTFSQTYQPSTGFTGQIFTIGSALDGEYVTGAIRLPKFLGPSTSFIAQSLFVSTKDHKYIVAAEQARDQWAAPGSQFITYGGNGTGFAGPWAATNLGSNILYTSWQGRIKTIAQDQEKDTGMFETYFDDPLGQYVSLNEDSLSFRKWYETLDHSRSSIRYVGNHVFATVYPIYAPAYNRFGQYVQSPTHRALAVASLDPRTLVGPVTNLVWEGFYDWLQPAQTVVLGDDFYVLSKPIQGVMKLYRLNYLKRDTHSTTIFTRGFFGSQDATQFKERTLVKGQLYFRKISGSFKVTICQLVDGDWIVAKECIANKKLLDFTVDSKHPTSSYGIPLKITIDHQGCTFELESIRVEGEGQTGY